MDTCCITKRGVPRNTTLDGDVVRLEWWWHQGEIFGIADVETPCASFFTGTTIIAYKIAGVGNCAGTGSWIESKKECEAAATNLGLPVNTGGVVLLAGNPYGCYYRKSKKTLWWNSKGDKADTDTDRVSVCMGRPSNQRRTPIAGPVVCALRFVASGEAELQVRTAVAKLRAGADGARAHTNSTTQRCWWREQVVEMPVLAGDQHSDVGRVLAGFEGINIDSSLEDAKSTCLQVEACQAILCETNVVRRSSCTIRAAVSMASSNKPRRAAPVDRSKPHTPQAKGAGRASGTLYTPFCAQVDAKKGSQAGKQDILVEMTRAEKDAMQILRKQVRLEQQLRSARAQARVKAGGGKCVNGDTPSLQCTVAELTLQVGAPILPPQVAYGDRHVLGGNSGRSWWEGEIFTEVQTKPTLWMAIVSHNTVSQLNRFVAHVVEVQRKNWADGPVKTGVCIATGAEDEVDTPIAIQRAAIKLRDAGFAIKVVLVKQEARKKFNKAAMLNACIGAVAPMSPHDEDPLIAIVDVDMQLPPDFVHQVARYTQRGVSFLSLIIYYGAQKRIGHECDCVSLECYEYVYATFCCVRFPLVVGSFVTLCWPTIVGHK